MFHFYLFINKVIEMFLVRTFSVLSFWYLQWRVMSLVQVYYCYASHFETNYKNAHGGGLCSFIPSLSAKLSYAFWINHYAATQANPLHLNVNMITKNKIKSECWGKKKTTTTITKKHKQPRNYTYIIYLRVWLRTYFKYSIYHSHWIFVISFWSSF